MLLFLIFFLSFIFSFVTFHCPTVCFSLFFHLPTEIQMKLNFILVFFPHDHKINLLFVVYFCYFIRSFKRDFYLSYKLLLEFLVLNYIILLEIFIITYSKLFYKNYMYSLPFPYPSPCANFGWFIYKHPKYVHIPDST